MLNWILAGLAILVGALVLAGAAFVALGLWSFAGQPHRRRQRCPTCGRRAQPGRERVEEAGGERSFTDGVHVEYTCPNGHAFTRRWTSALPGQ